MSIVIFEANSQARHRHASIWLTLLLFVAGSGSACHKAAQQGYAGTWVMSLGQRVFGVLIVDERGAAYSGSWTLPEHFDMGMGKNGGFSHVTNTSKRVTFASMSIKANRLHFVVPDPNAPAEPDEFDMTLLNNNEATVQYVGVPIAPWPFVRSQTRTVPVVATDWDPQKTYAVKEQTFSPNAEMRAIFDDDQRPRQHEISEAQWEIVSKEDAARRVRTRKLLDRDELHTAEDFREAAFVFQHGDTPDDYLLAHTLAMIAVAKGEASALWIGTATLDRYLQSTHQPQIYGTQFVGKSGDRMTQDPYHSDLISDSLRAELGVPSIAEQREQLKSMNSQQPAK
jgi:hypothetical protein